MKENYSTKNLTFYKAAKQLEGQAAKDSGKLNLTPSCPADTLPTGEGGVSKNLAFTLAEVLITLGVVGIVAAMTLPIVITKYQKKQTLIKSYKSLNIINIILNKMRLIYFLKIPMKLTIQKYVYYYF